MTAEQCVSGTSQTAPVLSSRFCGQFLNPGQPDATAQNVAICGEETKTNSRTKF